MCGSVCEQISSWFQVNPIIMVVGTVMIALTMFRLARRGRWLVIFAMIAGWIVVATLVMRILP